MGLRRAWSGEPFLLIEQDALAIVEPPVGAIGAEVNLLAIGREDGDGAAVSLTLTGDALRPPGPVHLAQSGTRMATSA